MEDNGLVERNIEHWNAVFSSRAWGKYPTEDLVRFVARSFNDVAQRPAQRVLEIGCGPGANLWFLAREGFRVSAIDGSAAAIEQARERLRKEGLHAEQPELKVGNFSTLPWPDATFDCVVDMVAIYANSLPTIEATIDEIFRVLKRGGLFFSKMFGPKTTGILTGELLDAQTSANPTAGPLAGFGVAHAFTEDEIARLLEKFSQIQIDWVHRSGGDRTCEYFEWIVQARK
jgi:ubiquinone/menaquinone biosynthesis C-methylase UbiE